MTKSLLIEIGVEELPAIPFLKELPNIEDKWHNILNRFALDAPFTFYYTPRRLVFISDAFLIKQPDATETFYGAPIEIAYKEGNPTPAALGFAKKCGVEIRKIGRAEKNGKEVLFYEKNVPGKESETLFETIIETFLKELQFGKSMRWGEGEESFIRPIRWVSVLFGDTEINMECFGVTSSLKTYGHRTCGYEAQPFNSIENYRSILKESSVILNPQDRKEIILSQFEIIEKENNISIEIDQDLLAEVVAITEYPNALMGTFEEHFLTLPPEVIVVSMKEHQRYFPVYKEGNLTNHFIVVSNADTDNFTQIIKGNEKVLRARLSDALFFYENDLKNGLQNEGLQNVTFMKGLGSIYEKSQREVLIAENLGNTYLNDATFQDDLTKCVMYAKADLLSDMVYEFTELQGLMGYYYATKAGEKPHIATAYKEQYLPDGEESALPSSDFSAIVALSNKLDTILSLFSIGEIPSGTKDPFALRRAALGIVKIVLDRKFAFDIDKNLKALSNNYQNIDTNLVETFFLERMSNFFDANPSVIQAVFASGERDIINISNKIEALNTIVEKESFKSSFSTFKRVANIIKDISFDTEKTVDVSRFETSQESALYNAYTNVIQQDYDTYEAELTALFDLKPDIDAFFDHVMVNAEDPNIKENRQNLIASIYLSFKNIADIKEISL